MATKIPTTMRAVALTKFCTPAEYQLGTLPVPKITRSDELLIRVRAASVNPVDVKLATSYVRSNRHLETADLLLVLGRCLGESMLHPFFCSQSLTFQKC
jgi:hypothetical protein